MSKKIIITIVAAFVIMIGVMVWISSSMYDTTTASNARTEADFTTQDFVVKELWEMQNKKGDQVLISYLYIKPENSDIKLRLPFEGSEADENALAAKIKPGQIVTVKVLKAQLAKASESGPVTAVTRFIKSDKREVTIFNLKTNNEVLVNRDIHDYDEANITTLSALINNPWIILVPFFIIIYAIAYYKRKKQTAATKTA